MTPTVDMDLAKEFPLLQGLAPDVIEEIAPFLSERRFAAGETIAREGDYCDGGYYLASGRVEVRFLPATRPTSARTTAQPASWRDRLRGVFSATPSATATREPERRVLVPEVSAELAPGDSAVLEAGDIFATESALSRFPLATDAVALTDVRAVLIRTQGLRKMLERPELAAFKERFDRVYRERVLCAHLRRVSLFRDLAHGVIERLVTSAQLVTFKPDNVIVTQGTPTEAFYLVRGGYVKVGVEVGRSIVAATYLRKGDWVGETGVLLDEPWPFSLTAIEHVELVKLSRESVRQALGEGDKEGELWKTLTEQLRRLARTVADPMVGLPLQYSTDSGLIHGESVLLIDLETCTRCDECVRACADVHDGTPRFVREGSRLGNYSVVTACFHCTDPVCMIPCPTGAITRPLGTREVAIDKDTCIGCGRCVRRCPWGNILQVPYDSPTLGKKIELASKCDLCVGRAEGPACVQMCPHGAAVRFDFKEDGQIDALFSRI